MIKIMTAAERHTSQKEWVHSEYSFSFADYDDPHNAHFGALLTHNDHLLQPRGMFDPVLHHDLEIVNIVLKGTIHYEDDTGEQKLESGSVQVVSTGEGLTHREKNESDTEEARLIQMWFLPDRRNIPSASHSKRFTRDQCLNSLQPVVGGLEGEEALNIALDIVIYRSVLRTDTEIQYALAEGRRMHVYLIEGNLEICSEDEGTFDLSPGDAARIKDCEDITFRGISSTGEAEFIVIDMP
ncbi:pirin family protein [Paenibacillus dakarensis]|uniref:pirin family protein n=1 Tax=Paenibacillus dakarensis TaxID=1527293 RepID=UPI0006D5B4F1|nr:pirin family protein [Paenibacillus dakarensis]